MFQVQKWGNSLGVRIPKAVARKVGLEEGSEIDFQIEGDKIIIRCKQRKLEDLLNQITPENLHEETPTGNAKGREVW
jgi:antitoxin MazE